MGVEILASAVFGGTVLFLAGRRPQRTEMRRNSFLTAAALVLLGAFALRLYLGYTSEGFSTDMDTFKAWGNMINDVGFSEVYNQDAFLDYPPGYLYVLSLLDHLRRFFRMGFYDPAYSLLLKLPSLLSDMACGGVLLWLGKRKLGEKEGLLLAAAYLFCPAVIINSAQWGQVDSITTALALCSILLLYRGNYIPSALLYGLGIACKPQMLIFAPLYLFFALKQKKYLKLLLCVFCALGMILLTAVPFTKGWDFLWLLQKYKSTLDYYNYYTINAYNFWSLLGWNWRGLPAGAIQTVLSLAAPVLATGLCGATVFLSKRKDVLFACPALLMGVMYLFGVKMHERYLYPVFFFLLLSFVFAPDKRLLRAYAGTVTANYWNVAYVLYLFREKGGNYDPNEFTARALAAAQIFALGYMLYVLWAVFCKGEVKEGLPKREGAWERPAQPDSRFTRTDWILMAAVTLVYGIAAFWSLGGHEMALTSWTPSEGDAVVLEADTDCDSIYYLPAIAPDSSHRGPRVGGNIRVETSRDGAAWTEVGNLSENKNYVYAWTHYDLKEPARWVRLTSLDGSSVLNEAALKLADTLGFASLAAEGPGAENLIDEQGIVPNFTTYENSTYFDEIYHARTAYENILGLEPYENTHPPLGKYIISLGIRIFGMNPFGWRFMGALFGVLMLPLLYWLLKQLFGKALLCCCGTLWFAFDFMHFTQTRIATIDTYAVFFLLLMYNFMVWFLKKDLLKDSLKNLLVPLLLCGISMGLGVASKWTAAYGAVGLALLFFGKLALSFRDAYRNRKPDLAPLRKRAMTLCLWCCLFFILIPFGLYFAAYLPLTTLPHNVYDVWGRFWSYQTTMFNYHSGLQDTHYFASPWYEWPFDVRPIWYFSGEPANELGQYSTISAMGSPLFWWAGIPALIAAAVLWARERKTWAAVVLCGFASVYVPWILVPRITFIYHYFTAVPFLTVALAGSFLRFSETKLGARRLSVGKYSASLSSTALVSFTALNLALFCVFFPVISGLPVSKAYTTALRLFPTWYF